MLVSVWSLHVTPVCERQGVCFVSLRFPCYGLTDCPGCVLPSLHVSWDQLTVSQLDETVPEMDGGMCHVCVQSR